MSVYYRHSISQWKAVCFPGRNTGADDEATIFPLPFMNYLNFSKLIGLCKPQFPLVCIANFSAGTTPHLSRKCVQSGRQRAYNKPLIIQSWIPGKTSKEWVFSLPMHQSHFWGSLVAQMVKNMPALWEIRVWSLDCKDPLEKGMVTHSSVLVWRIPWTEEQRVRHNWATNTLFTQFLLQTNYNTMPRSGY